MTTKIEDIFDQFSKQPEKLLPELRRIRLAVELSAALQAFAFFKAQGGTRAADRLAPMIQNLTAQLCKER